MEIEPGVRQRGFFRRIKNQAKKKLHGEEKGLGGLKNGKKKREGRKKIHCPS